MDAERDDNDVPLRLFDCTACRRAKRYVTDPGRGCDGADPPKPTGREGVLWPEGWVHGARWVSWLGQRRDLKPDPMGEPPEPLRRCPRLDATSYEQTWLREFLLFDGDHAPARPWPAMYRDTMITLGVEKSLIEHAKHEARKASK